MSPLAEIVICAVLGIASGTLAGFLGMGGGSILPPLLGVMLGVSQHLAQGISLAALLPPVGLPAVLAYRRSGTRIDARLVGLLIVGFLGGVAGGAWIAHRVPSRELRWVFALFLLVSAARALIPDRTPIAVGSHDEIDRRAALPIGLVAGALSGLLGVGGGIVALPLLRRFAKLTRLEAQATTLALMLPPIGLPAVLVYASEQGGLPWSLLGAVALGFAAGSGLGARFAGRVSALAASRVYAALLVVTAAMLLFA